jgi:CheY-like chemotaxis protein
MSSERIHVLIVEYDEVSARAARTMLQRLGCRATVARNGAEAIEGLRQAKFDLILMDWQMPVMNGFEATARIRALPEAAGIPIVGTSENMVRAECLAIGMNDLMPKPFLMEKLRQILSKWTGWSEAGSEPAG